MKGCAGEVLKPAARRRCSGSHLERTSWRLAASGSLDATQRRRLQTPEVFEGVEQLQSLGLYGAILLPGQHFGDFVHLTKLEFDTEKLTLWQVL